MNMCVQIVLYFLVYVLSYRIYSNSQVSTSSCCHNKDVDDMNERTELERDIEGLEEISSLPRDILEALNRESEGSKPNIEVTEVVTLLTKVKMKNSSRLGQNFL